MVRRFRRRADRGGGAVGELLSQLERHGEQHPAWKGGGGAVVELLAQQGHEVAGKTIVPDDPARVRDALRAGIETPEVDVVIATGGTGITWRDGTYEVVSALLDKRIDGFGELFRALSYQEIGPAAMLSRACAGLARGTIVISLPGSENAVRPGDDEARRAGARPHGTRGAPVTAAKRLYGRRPGLRQHAARPAGDAPSARRNPQIDLSPQRARDDRDRDDVRHPPIVHRRLQCKRLIRYDSIERECSIRPRDHPTADKSLQKTRTLQRVFIGAADDSTWNRMAPGVAHVPGRPRFKQQTDTHAGPVLVIHRKKAEPWGETMRMNQVCCLC